jgi:hypothetical protein
MRAAHRATHGLLNLPTLMYSAVQDALRTVQEARRSGFSLVRNLATAASDALGVAPGESLIPGVQPIVLKGLADAEAAAELVDQLPAVVASISRGASEFEPSPSEMRRLVASNFYPSPGSPTSPVPSSSCPLVVQFADDGIDESDVLVSLLQEASKGMQEERVSHKLVTLPGTHVTPLAIDPNSPTTPLLPIPEQVYEGDLREGLLGDADKLVDTLGRLPRADTTLQSERT